MDLDWVQKKLRGRVAHWGKKSGAIWQRYSHDALALGLVEAWEVSLSGCTDEQCVRAGTTAALTFVRQMLAETNRTVSLTVFEDDDGDTWYPGSSLPDQETSTDARAIARVIDDYDTLETIAYGTRHEGGLKRMSAEIRVNNYLKKERRG